MKDSIHRYLQVEITQWMSYLQGNPMESLKTIREDDFFNTTESKGYGYRNEGARRLLEQSHLRVCYGVQSRLLDGKSNPNDLDEEGRRKAEATLIEAVDEVEHLGAKGIALLVGKWQLEIKEQACIQFLETARAVYDYLAEESMMVELEVLDYDMDKVTLTGPAPYAAESAADIRTAHSSFGFLVDSGHLPTTYETGRFVVHTLRLYITHFHFGNAVIVKGYDGYDDLHPRFGYPNSADDTPRLLGYFKVMGEEGFFDAENPYVLSMEVTLRLGKDGGIVLASIEGVLKRAWALLEDDA